MDVRFTDDDGFIGPPDGRVFPRFMGPVHVRAAPADRPGVSMGRRGGRGAVRHRDELPAGRAVRADRHPAGVAHAPHLPPGPRGASRSRRSRWSTPVTSRAARYVIDDAIARDRGGRLRSSRRRRSTGARLRRRPHDRLPAAAGEHRVHGPVALVHFDAHVDTYDTYMGAPFTHGTPFRRAAEEALFVPDTRCTSASAVRSTARRTSTRTPPSASSVWAPGRSSGSGRRATSSGSASAWVTGRSTSRSTSTCSTRRSRRPPARPRPAGSPAASC